MPEAMNFAEVVAALRYGVRSLFRLSGRDGRWLFWPWGLCVVGLTYTVNTALAQGMFFSGILRVYDVSRPGDVEAVRAFANIFPQMETLWLSFAISEAIAVLLLAGAVTRRLHDRDWSGAWGLLPLPFLAIGIWQMSGTFDHALKALPNLSSLKVLDFLSGPLSFAAIAVLGVMFAREGTPGPNRFGDATRGTP